MPWSKRTSSGGIVTALPSNPSDGQIVFYQASGSMATSGIVWQLRYNSASSSAYKWELIGGSSLTSEVQPIEYAATSNAYGVLTTAGPSVTLPLSGDYDITLGATVWQPLNTDTSHYMSYDIGATGAQDADGIWTRQLDATAPRTVASQFRTRRKAGLSAVTLTAKYKAGAGTCGWGNRTITVIPVRVG